MQSDGLSVQNNELLSKEEQKENMCQVSELCIVLQVRGVCVMRCWCYVGVANSVVRYRM